MSLGNYLNRNKIGGLILIIVIIIAFGFGGFGGGFLSNNQNNIAKINLFILSTFLFPCRSYHILSTYKLSFPLVSDHDTPMLVIY